MEKTNYILKGLGYSYILYKVLLVSLAGGIGGVLGVNFK